MKYILTILSLILITSCGNNETIEISKSEYNKLIGDTLLPKPFKLYRSELDYLDDGVVFASDGHEYLVINNNSNTMNVEHYIECRKCQK